MADGETVSRFRVRYAETDAMGIAHHSQYIIWFEVGRSDWFREKGASYTLCEAQGVRFPVAEMSVRFSQPAFYDNAITVRTRLSEIRSRSVTFRYQVHDETGALLATGHTRHICVNEERQTQTIPDWLREILEENLERSS